MSGKKCVDCNLSLGKVHFNTKRCRKCKSLVLKKPIGRLSLEQEKKVRKLAGTMKIKELAQLVGASDSTLDRWAKQNGVNINWLKYREEEINKVCAYYEKHGKIKTQKRFPDLNVRAIVERNYDKFSPRQIRWSGSQLIELARMAGLVSFKAQAKYFNRPRANKGAIKSVWIKNYKLSSGQLNGMPWNRARHLVSKECPKIRRYLETRSGKKPHKDDIHKICLWVDMEKHFKPNVPEFLRDGIKGMAEFQRWLFKSKKPKTKILKMIKEREL